MKQFRVLTHPPGQETAEAEAVELVLSKSHDRAVRASERMSAARCVIPARIYRSAGSDRALMSEGGRRERSFRRLVRTEEEPSRRRGRSLGRIIAGGKGRGWLTGWEELVDQFAFLIFGIRRFLPWE